MRDLFNFYVFTSLFNATYISLRQIIHVFGLNLDLLKYIPTINATKNCTIEYPFRFPFVEITDSPSKWSPGIKSIPISNTDEYTTNKRTEIITKYFCFFSFRESKIKTKNGENKYVTI